MAVSSVYDCGCVRYAIGAGSCGDVWEESATARVPLSDGYSGGGASIARARAGDCGCDVAGLDTRLGRAELNERQLSNMVDAR